MNITTLKVGDALQTPQWYQITQQTINNFAEVTGDFQWIHLDVERCKSESPFKTTIAHGFLTAALMPMMFAKSITIDTNKFTMLNYGIDCLRYLEPVKVDDRIKFSFVLGGIDQKKSGSLHKFNTTVNIMGREKPALVGDFLMLLIEK